MCPTHFVHRLFVTEKAAPLARMMVDLSAYPRGQERTGWLAPTVGSIEFLQHLVQVGRTFVSFVVT